ncbi:response regulator transcription factor [Brevibacterium linens]|uniref:helix-turn-helix transcriptional regulator n=1 Tax=Brevibacterium linens TaxID=1703 RepID=UPI003BF5C2FD
MLNAAIELLRTSGYGVTHVQGVASLKKFPLAALNLAGIGSTRDPSSVDALVNTTEALRKQFSQARHIIAIDDWDELDEASWGVIEMLRRTTNARVITTRLKTVKVRHTPSGIPTTNVEPSYYVELGSLPYKDLATVIEQQLGAPIASATMSRIYAKTNGIVGLARSIVTTAAHENNLRLVNEIWTAQRHLWSNSLRGYMEAYLDDISAEARDALEIISILGEVDINTMKRFADLSTLELLEERAMVDFINVGDKRILTVTPPLLVEYFRREPSEVRRTRLAELVKETMAGSPAASAAFDSIDSTASNTADNDPLLVRLLHERTRTKQAIAYSEWEQHPTPMNAVRFYTVARHSTATNQLMHRVFHDTEIHGTDRYNTALFVAAMADWQINVQGNLDEGLRTLTSCDLELGEYSHILDACRVSHQLRYSTLPDDYNASLEITDDLPAEVTIYVLEVQLFVLIALGYFDQARTVFSSLSDFPAGPSHHAKALYGYVLLGSGHYTVALDWAQAGLEEARAALDVDAIRAYGTVVAFCHQLSGEYAALDAILKTLFAIGTTQIPLAIGIAMLNFGTYTAYRTGNIALGERYARDIEAYSAIDGPLPRQSKVWSRAQSLTFAGKTAQAAEAMRTSADQLWSRGARFAAALAYATALEIDTELPEADVIIDRVRSVGSPLTTTHVDYSAAIKARDAEDLAQLAPELRRTGRIGLALNAYTVALQRFKDAGDTERTADLEREYSECKNTLGDRRFETATFHSTTISLSDREREVAALVAAGLSNQQIAAKLVLSVRTVESHIYRILRKTGASNRHEIVSDRLH